MLLIILGMACSKLKTYPSPQRQQSTPTFYNYAYTLYDVKSKTKINHCATISFDIIPYIQTNKENKHSSFIGYFLQRNSDVNYS